jgi:hypothetical protein
MWFLTAYTRRRKIQLAAADEHRMCHEHVLACIRFPAFFETTSVIKDSITPLRLFVEATQTALLGDFQAQT